MSVQRSLHGNVHIPIVTGRGNPSQTPSLFYQGAEDPEVLELSYERLVEFERICALLRPHEWASPSARSRYILAHTRTTSHQRRQTPGHAQSSEMRGHSTRRF